MGENHKLYPAAAAAIVGLLRDYMIGLKYLFSKYSVLKALAKLPHVCHCLKCLPWLLASRKINKKVKFIAI